MIGFLLWLLLLVFCWPLALAALLLYPIVWLVLLPFRLIGIAVVGVLALLRALILLRAPNAAEAIKVSQRHAGPIHLLVTDVVMPHIGGQELARRLSVERPRMRVLYMSGYTDNTIVHHGVLESGVAFLQKPITPEKLCRKVREVLDPPK